MSRNSFYESRSSGSDFALFSIVVASFPAAQPISSNIEGCTNSMLQPVKRPGFARFRFLQPRPHPRDPHS